MKEIYIDREDLHHVIYPAVLAGEVTGQHDLEGRILFIPNEERYPVVKPCEERPANVLPKSPLQGEFILVKPWENKIHYD